MKNQRELKVLIPLIALGAFIESLTGIFSKCGAGPYLYKTIRGETVEIYGRGIYRHMTTDVAVQGIAQDYITLFLAIPILLISFFYALRGYRKSKLIFSGALLYFTLTYLFYIGIAMYNEMFLVAVFTLFCSLFSFIINIIGFDFQEIKQSFKLPTNIFPASVLLIIVGIMMSLLWLSVIIPPMIDGSFYPKGLAHYSTLIVQGFDLGIFLPLAIISGVLGVRKHPYAYVLVPTYFVFLCILMAALISKILFMRQIGANVIPVIFIIPSVWVTAFLFTIFTFKKIK